MSKLFLTIFAPLFLALAITSPQVALAQDGALAAPGTEEAASQVQAPPVSPGDALTGATMGEPSMGSEPISQAPEGAQAPEAPQAPEAQQVLAPKLTFDSMEYNGGTSPPGTTVTHDFTVTNAGTDALLIYEVVPGCGCTVVSFDKFIPPGKSGTITVNVDLYREWAGQDYYKAVTVITNDPEQPRLRLLMRGKIGMPTDGKPLNRVTPPATDASGAPEGPLSPKS